MPDTEFGYSQLSETQPKGSILRLVLLLAILAVCLLIYLGNKEDKEPVVTADWPTLKWENILIAHKSWLSGYNDNTVSELEVIAQKDPNITIFLSKMKQSELIYFLQIINRNIKNKKFLNSPVEVVPELKSKESLANLDKALLQIKEIELSFTKLQLHGTFFTLHDKFKKYNPSIAEFKLRMKAENIIEGYKRASNAELWLARLQENKTLIDNIKAQKDWEKVGVSDILPTYLKFLQSLNPYKDSLDSDIYNVSLKNLLKSLQERTPVKPSAFAKPLLELGETLEELKKDVNDESYAAAVSKLGLVKEKFNQGTDKEKEKFYSLEKEILSLKPPEKQMAISSMSKLDYRESDSTRNWPRVEIKTAFSSYCFFLKVLPRNEVSIEEPDTLTDKKIDKMITKQLRFLPAFRKVTVKAVCFTYFKDAQAFYNLGDINEAAGTNFISTEKMETFLKKLNPKTFAVKELTLEK